MQLIIILLAVVLILSGVDFKKLYNYVPSKQSTNSPERINSELEHEDVHIDKPDLVDVVSQWEQFKNTCEALELKDAVQKLDEIFPMLIKAEKE